MLPTSIKNRAIRDYMDGERLATVALRYKISIGTVSLWAKQVGLKRRERGCRKKSLPSEIDMQVVEAVRAVKDGKPTLTEIGDDFGGFSRANVHRIFHKWKDYKPKSPFKAGDIVRVVDKNFEPQDYEVLQPGPFKGMCKHIKTGAEIEITWVTWVEKETAKGRRARTTRIEAVKV